MNVTERYTRTSENYLIVEIIVKDSHLLAESWRSAPRRWTLSQTPINEFICINNRELEEPERLKQLLEAE